MTAGEWITAIILFMIAGAFLILGIRSFLERGFLLNNTYIYATEEERKTMDKKPYYRQSAVVFCILSAVFLVIGLSLLLKNDKLLLAQIPLSAGAVVYAIASTVHINKKTRK